MDLKLNKILKTMGWQPGTRVNIDKYWVQTGSFGINQWTFPCEATSLLRVIPMSGAKVMNAK